MQKVFMKDRRSIERRKDRTRMEKKDAAGERKGHRRRNRALPVCDPQADKCR